MSYIIYGASWCKYCADAEKLLNHYGLWYDYNSVDDILEEEAERAQKFIKDGGYKKLPQIFVVEDGVPRHIGGYTELKKELLQGNHDTSET